MPRKGNRKSRRSSKKSSGCGMMWGGAGTADHAIAVYGGIGQQTAQAGGNVIAEKPVGQLGGAPLAPAQFGGAPLSPATIQIGGDGEAVVKLPDGIDQTGGDGEAVKLPEGTMIQSGGSITELAVPAVLVLANQSMRRRRDSSKKRRSFRRRRSNRRR